MRLGQEAQGGDGEFGTLTGKRASVRPASAEMFHGLERRRLERRDQACGHFPA